MDVHYPYERSATFIQNFESNYKGNLNLTGRYENDLAANANERYSVSNFGVELNEKK